MRRYHSASGRKQERINDVRSGRESRSVQRPRKRLNFENATCSSVTILGTHVL